MILFDRVTERIFVGTCPTSTVDLNRLKQAGFTAVLSLQTDGDFITHQIPWPHLEQGYLDLGIALYRVPIIDFDHQDLASRLPAAADQLGEIVEIHDRVYVHCTAGMQRAPSTVIGHLAWNCGMGLAPAIEWVTSARHCDPPMEALEIADTLVQQTKSAK